MFGAVVVEGCHMSFELEAIKQREMLNAGKTQNVRKCEAENAEKSLMHCTSIRTERSPSFSILFDHQPWVWK